MTSLKQKTYRIIGFSFIVAAITGILSIVAGTFIEQRHTLHLLGESLIQSSQKQLPFLIPGLLVQEEFISVKQLLKEIIEKEKLKRAEIVQEEDVKQFKQSELCSAGPSPSEICIDLGKRSVKTLVPIILSAKEMGILLKERQLSKEELPLEFFLPITVLVIGFLFAFALVALWMGYFLQRDVRQPLMNLTNTLAPILENKREGKLPQFELLEVQTLATQVGTLIKSFEERQVNAAISETAQMLAHDVKRPFVVLKTGLNAIQDETDPARIKELVSSLLPDVEKSLVNVEALISDIQEVSSKTKPTIQPIDVEELVSNALEQVFKANPPMNIELSYDWKHSYKLLADIIRAPRIFSNIISNAVEAMRGDGEIYFKTNDHKDGNLNYMEIVIGNSNSEISEEDLPKVFEKFYTKGKRGGTGLGLAIVDKLVSEHGGKVWCTSIAGKKVEFHLILPVSNEKASQPLASLPQYSLFYKGRNDENT